MPKSSLHLALVMLTCALLTGCLLPKERQEVLQPATATQYSTTVDKRNLAPAEQSDPEEDTKPTELLGAPNAEAQTNWWSGYASEELNRLVDRGLGHSPEIRIALSRITQLKARYTQASAGKKPTLSAPIAAANQAPGGTSIGTAPSSSQQTNGASSSTGNRLSSQKTYQASIRAEWRLDLWGEQAALADAAEFQLQRAVHERDNVERNLVANIVSTYIDYLSLNDRLSIANQTEQTLLKTLEILERRLHMGDASLAEVAQQQASIYSLQATIPTLEQQRIEALNSLAILIGAIPGELTLSNAGMDSLKIPSNSALRITGSDLLQRPDIRASEAQLLAAKADIDVARARMLPTLDLAAQSGSSSMTAQNLFSAGTLFWNVVANIGVNLFDGGRRKGEQQFSRAMQEEILETYVKTIHQALRETENAKSAIRQIEQRAKAHQAASDAAKKAWDINRKVFELGALDYLSLLDSQRNYNRYFDDLQKTRADLLKVQIPLLQLHQASQAPISIPDELPDHPAYWQVELENAFHQTAVPAVQRDFQSRFPNIMDSRMIRPQEISTIDFKTTGKQAWYRLNVAPFSTPEDALAFCDALQPEQRCRVTRSASDKTVTAADLVH